MSFLSHLMEQGSQLLAHPPAALDHYFEQIRHSLAAKTHTAVYEECHKQSLHEPVRSVIEVAVGALPINPPRVLAGPVVALLHKMEFKRADGKSEVGVLGFIQDVVQRNQLDREVRRSATRGLLRFAHEHTDFVQAVGVEALLQKLQRSDQGHPGAAPISTVQSVPYVRPPPLSAVDFDKQFPEPPGDRGLLGDLIHGAVNAIGANTPTLAQAVVAQVQNDPAVRQKLDEYAQEIKVKVCSDTERTIYEQSHAQRVHELLRLLVEQAVEHMPLQTPAFLSGPIGAFLQHYQPAAGSRDTTPGPKGFFLTQIHSLGMDREVKHSALRALEHYIVEHKDFLLHVGVESVIQKLKDEPKISTAAAVPYQKPPPLTVEQFNQQNPDMTPPPGAAAAAAAAPSPGQGQH